MPFFQSRNLKIVSEDKLASQKHRGQSTLFLVLDRWQIVDEDGVPDLVYGLILFEPIKTAPHLQGCSTNSDPSSSRLRRKTLQILEIDAVMPWVRCPEICEFDPIDFVSLQIGGKTFELLSPIEL